MKHNLSKLILLRSKKSLTNLLVKVGGKILIVQINKIIKELTKEITSAGLYKTSSSNIFTTILTCRILAETAELLAPLAPTTNKKILTLIKKCSASIEHEKSFSDSWNYWLKDSTEYSITPYPDDLDDTFNAHLLSLISKSRTIGNHSFTARNLQNITNQLLNTERKVPQQNIVDQHVNNDLSAYNTWIFKKSDASSLDLNTHINFEDIDPVVQVIIYKVLSRLKSVPNKFKEFLASKMLDFNFLESKYYDSKLYVLSELSSVSLGDINEGANTETKNVRDAMIDHYKQLENGYPNHCSEPNRGDKARCYFDAILKAQIEMNLGIFFNHFNVHSTFKDIFKNTLKLYACIFISKSKIRAEPIFIESVSKGNKTYCYSKSVVLALYLKLSASIGSGLNSVLENEKDSQYQALRRESFTKLYQEMKFELLLLGTKSINVDTTIQTIFNDQNPLQTVHGELFDLAHNLKNSRYLTKQDLSVFNSVYEATLLGWISYTAYDAIIDKEIPKTFLPFANMCNTRMFDILFKKTYMPDSIRETILHLIEEINSAQYTETHKNADETIDCENIKPIGKNLQSSKSIGHCIGPICIFAHIARRWNKADLSNLIEFYRYYLSVKQLSDDVHDWQEDISANRKTFVTEIISRKYKSESKIVDPEMIAAFTTSAIYKVHEEMKAQTDTAISHLLQLKHYFNDAYIQERLKDTAKYAAGVQQAITEIEVYNLFTTS